MLRSLYIFYTLCTILRWSWLWLFVKSPFVLLSSLFYHNNIIITTTAPSKYVHSHHIQNSKLQNCYSTHAIVSMFVIICMYLRIPPFPSKFTPPVFYFLTCSHHVLSHLSSSFLPSPSIFLHFSHFIMSSLSESFRRDSRVLSFV